MTEVNLKVKIHIVDTLFVGDGYRTDVWISEGAKRELSKLVRGKKKRLGQAFLKKLEHYAKAGFAVFEGAKRPIKYEWDEVYRVADSALFRLIGFYVEGKASFVVIDAFTKRGQQLSKGQMNRITEVGRVKRLRSWKRRDHE